VLLTRRGDIGFPRLPALFKSLVKFFPATLVHSLLLVVPQGDLPAFTGGALPALGDLRRAFPATLVADDTLLSAPVPTFEGLLPDAERPAKGGRGAGYRLQMLLKLLVSRLVATPFYITLDSDVFACRHVSYADLVDPEGRALIRRQGERMVGTRHQLRWWKAAEAILQAPHCVTGRAEPVIGVTPALLATNLSRGAVAAVEAITKQPFDQAMFAALRAQQDWTEYTFYWVYGCKAGLLQRYHRLRPDLKLYDSSGFEWGSFARWHPEKLFQHPTAVFGVMQSIAGASPDAVNARLLPLLQ